MQREVKCPEAEGAGCWGGARQRVDAKGSDRSEEGTGFIDHNVYVSLPVAVIRHSDKGNLRVTGLILAHSLRYNPSWLGSQGSWNLKHLSDVTPMVRTQGNERMYSAHLNLFLQPKPLQPQSREWSCLPTSVNVMKMALYGMPRGPAPS